MAEITVQVADRAGATLAYTTVAATTAAAPDWFVNTGREVLHVQELGSGGTLALVRTGQVDGQTPADRAIVVAAGQTVIVGPFPTQWYSSSVSLYKSAGGIKVAVVRQ